MYIYSCPDGSGGTKSAPVKQRMLYSSSKANVSQIAAAADIVIAARVCEQLCFVVAFSLTPVCLQLEVNKGSEVTAQVLMDTLHPPKEEKTTGFARPARPGKGPARLVRDKK